MTVFAASSLQGTLDRVVDRWAQKTGGSARISYAASSALARQIEAGAPADLFISADLEWMDWVQARGLVREGTRRVLARNALVLIAQANDPVELALRTKAPLVATLGTSRLAMGDPASVPVGRYAQAALKHLGLWTEIEPRIAAAANTRAALTLVARGEARLGIVYATDAIAEPRVRTVAAFPADSHPPILYPMAQISASQNAAAADLLTFLRSAEALDLLKREGFLPPD